MTYQDVLDFVGENPVCSLATVEPNGQPRVRGFLSVLFEDGKIYFTTSTTKQVWKQIEANPMVEMLHFTPDFSRVLRITGELEDVDDREKKQKLIDERDYLKGWMADDPEYKLLRVRKGNARFWTMADNLKEDCLEVIEF